MVVIRNEVIFVRKVFALLTVVCLLFSSCGENRESISDITGENNLSSEDLINAIQGKYENVSVETEINSVKGFVNLKFLNEYNVEETQKAIDECVGESLMKVFHIAKFASENFNSEGKDFSVTFRMNINGARLYYVVDADCLSYLDGKNDMQIIKNIMPSVHMVISGERAARDSVVKSLVNKYSANKSEITVV